VANASSRFLFERDFSRPQADAKVEAAAAEAEARGYARGLAAGRQQAEGERAAELARACARLAAAAEALLASADRVRAETETEAIALAEALAHKLAGAALAALPKAAIAEAAAAAFQHLRQVPHLAARVNEGLVEEVEAMLLGMARERGFEGRLVVLGDPGIQPGDVRLEWADGGVVRDHGATAAALREAVSGQPRF
jgi:flagellar assembly protein FliH